MGNPNPEKVLAVKRGLRTTDKKITVTVHPLKGSPGRVPPNDNPLLEIVSAKG
jgi:hypothetical protein